MRLIKPAKTDQEIYKGMFILIPESGIDYEFLKGWEKGKTAIRFVDLGTDESHAEVWIE